MEAWNPPASALELLPVEVEDARSHNLGLSQGSAGLRTVHATQFPVSGFGFLLYMANEMKRPETLSGEED